MAFWDAAREMDEVLLENLEVPCVVGLYPREKLEMQPLLVTLRLFCDTRRAATSCSLRFSIDYAVLAGEVRFVLQNAHFRLLETAAEAICRHVLAPPAGDQPRAVVEACEVTIRKPRAVANTVAAVTVRRTSQEVSAPLKRQNIGLLTMIHDTPDCSLYRLEVPAHSATPAFIHTNDEVAEMALSDGLWLQNKPLAAGIGYIWPKHFPRRYVNPTGLDRYVLCIARGGVNQFTPYLSEACPESLRDLPAQNVRPYYSGIDPTPASRPSH